jgi:hypothetical protein
MPIPAEAIDLLICCASVDSEKGSRLESLIAKGVDWKLLNEQKERHGILPFSAGHREPLFRIKFLIRSSMKRSESLVKSSAISSGPGGFNYFPPIRNIDCRLERRIQGEEDERFNALYVKVK